MTIKRKYRVHGGQPAKITKSAVVDGVETQADVNGYLVELVPVEGGSSAVSLTFTHPDEVKAAKEIFHEGATFTWVIA